MPRSEIKAYEPNTLGDILNRLVRSEGDVFYDRSRRLKDETKGGISDMVFGDIIAEAGQGMTPSEISMSDAEARFAADQEKENLKREKAGEDRLKEPDQLESAKDGRLMLLQGFLNPAKSSQRMQDLLEKDIDDYVDTDVVVARVFLQGLEAFITLTNEESLRQQISLSEQQQDVEMRENLEIAMLESVVKMRHKFEERIFGGAKIGTTERAHAEAALITRLSIQSRADGLLEKSVGTAEKPDDENYREQLWEYIFGMRSTWFKDFWGYYIKHRNERVGLNNQTYLDYVFDGIQAVNQTWEAIQSAEEGKDTKAAIDRLSNQWLDGVGLEGAVNSMVPRIYTVEQVIKDPTQEPNYDPNDAEWQAKKDRYDQAKTAMAQRLHVEEDQIIEVRERHEEFSFTGPWEVIDNLLGNTAVSLETRKRPGDGKLEFGLKLNGLFKFDGDGNVLVTSRGNYPELSNLGKLGVGIMQKATIKKVIDNFVEIDVNGKATLKTVYLSDKVFQDNPWLKEFVQRGTIDSQFAYRDDKTPRSLTRLAALQRLKSMSPFDLKDSGLTHGWINYATKKLQAELEEKGMSLANVVGVPDKAADFTLMDIEDPDTALGRVVKTQANRGKAILNDDGKILAMQEAARAEVGGAVVAEYEIRDAAMYSFALKLLDVTGQSGYAAARASGASESLDKFFQANYVEGYTAIAVHLRDLIQSMYSMLDAWRRDNCDPNMIALNGNTKGTQSRWTNPAKPSDASIIAPIAEVNGADSNKVKQAKALFEELFFASGHWRMGRVSLYRVFNSLRYVPDDSNRRDRLAKARLRFNTRMQDIRDSKNPDSVRKSLNIAPVRRWLSKPEVLNRIEQLDPENRALLYDTLDLGDYIRSIGVNVSEDYSRGALGIAVAAEHTVSARTRLYGQEYKLFKRIVGNKYFEKIIAAVKTMAAQWEPTSIQALDSLVMDKIGAVEGIANLEADGIGEALYEEVHKHLMSALNLQSKEEVRDYFKDVTDYLEGLVNNFVHFNADEQRMNVEEIIAITLANMDRQMAMDFKLKNGMQLSAEGVYGEKGSARVRYEVDLFAEPTPEDPNLPKKELIRLESFLTDGHFIPIFPEGSVPEDFDNEEFRREVIREANDTDESYFAKVRDYLKSRNIAHSKIYFMDQQATQMYLAENKFIDTENLTGVHGHRGLTPGLAYAIIIMAVDKGWIHSTETMNVYNMYKRYNKEIKDIYK